MSGIHVNEAPGFSGWTRLRDGGWKTLDAVEIADVRAALAADVAACPTCQRGGMMPAHATYTYVHEATADRRASAHTYHCRSLSRWYNPQTGEMEGRAHCTCDSCF